MFLDDLPSATRYDGKDHFGENIPIGFVPDDESTLEDAEEDSDREEYHPVNIFNHLDLTVIVHETELANHTGTYSHGGEKTQV